MLPLMPKLFYMTEEFKLINNYKWIKTDTIQHKPIGVYVSLQTLYC